MAALNQLVTVVVISARDLQVIPPGLCLALDSGLRVIISRPESLPRIDHLSHSHLEIIWKSIFFQRLYLSLNRARTPYVFLSADDDFILIDNLLPAIQQMMMERPYPLLLRRCMPQELTNQYSDLANVITTISIQSV